MTTVNTQYKKAWESFWSSLSGEEEAEEVLWSVDPSLAVEADFKRFESYITANNLPLVDVGCGDGYQTQFLAEQISQQVIGVDVSARIIDFAIAQNEADNLKYQVLDILDAEACQAFHAEVGDANIYIRTVIMQFSPADRLVAIENVKLLLGAEGYVYLSEYPPKTEEYYGSIIEKEGMPPGFARVLEHGITPGGISQAELETFFPADEYQVVEQGEHIINTHIKLKSGELAKAPAIYLLAKRK